MSDKIKTFPGGLYFITMTVVGWVDVFTRRENSSIIIESLEYSQKHKGLEIYGYVIMTNHLHMIVSRKEGIIGDWVRDFKTYTSKRLTELILNNPLESRKDWMEMVFKYHAKLINRQTGFSFWHDGYFPVELHSNYLIDQKLEYIHNNPVRAGYVLNQEDWRLSSACVESPVKVLTI